MTREDLLNFIETTAAPGFYNIHFVQAHPSSLAGLLHHISQKRLFVFVFP